MRLIEKIAKMLGMDRMDNTSPNLKLLEMEVTKNKTTYHYIDRKTGTAIKKVMYFED